VKAFVYFSLDGASCYRSFSFVFPSKLLQFGTLFKLALRFGEEMERSCEGAENFYNFFFPTVAKELGDLLGLFFRFLDRRLMLKRIPFLCCLEDKYTFYCRVSM